MNNDDRRIRKTKKALCEALAELMQNKELHNISVQELSDKADVHRATFYSHYKDIYDLYQQLEDSAMEELGAILVYDALQKSDEIFQSLFRYIEENKKIIEAFLCKNRNSKFLDRIIKLTEKNFSLMWKDEMGDLLYSDEWIFFSRYHIQGCLAIITSWMEQGYSYPKEEVIKMISNLDNHYEKFILSMKNSTS